MKSACLALAACTLMTAGAASAAVPPKLSLADALHIALQENAGLKQAEEGVARSLSDLRVARITPGCPAGPWAG